jgi:hypothetical protein
MRSIIRMFSVLFAVLVAVSSVGYAHAEDTVNVGPLYQVGSKENPAKIGTPLSAGSLEVTVNRVEVQGDDLIVDATIKNLRAAMNLTTNALFFTLGYPFPAGGVGDINLKSGESKDVSVTIKQSVGRIVNSGRLVSLDFLGEFSSDELEGMKDVMDVVGYWWLPL